VFVVHATKKLLERVKAAPGDGIQTSTTALGDWYATALFWRPQLALFVNEITLLPVLLPLAPAISLAERFVPALAVVLAAHEAGAVFIAAETEQMGEHRWAKTSNRSIVGMMTEFSFLAEAWAPDRSEPDLVDLALRLARAPCGPLYRRHISPDRELAALLS
jgi:hypothetical protein